MTDEAEGRAALDGGMPVKVKPIPGQRYTHTRSGKKGRPPKFNEAKMIEVCDRVANGESLLAICQEHGMPSRATFYNWVAENPVLLRRFAISAYLRNESFCDEILRVSRARSLKAYPETVDGKAEAAANELEGRTFEDKKNHIDTLFRLMGTQQHETYAKQFPNLIAPPELPKNGDDAKLIGSNAPEAMVIEGDPLNNSLRAFQAARGK